MHISVYQRHLHRHVRLSFATRVGSIQAYVLVAQGACQMLGGCGGCKATCCMREMRCKL